MECLFCGKEVEKTKRDAYFCCEVCSLGEITEDCLSGQITVCPKCCKKENNIRMPEGQKYDRF